MNAGDVVIDREADDPDRAVVVNTPPVTADEWEVAGERTVADDNPEYDAEESVVCVVFLDDLKTSHPDYDGSEQIRLKNLEADFYTFPQPRLEKVDELGGDPVGPPGDLAAIEERLAAGGMDVSLVNDHLVAGKLGELYTIHRDGTVEGDGALAGRVRAAVEEITGGKTKI